MPGITGTPAISETPIRAYMALESTRALLQDHKALYEELKVAVIKAAPEEAFPPLPQKCSPQDEQMFASIESSKQKPSNKFDTSNSDMNVDFRVRGAEAPAKTREDGAG